MEVTSTPTNSRPRPTQRLSITGDGKGQSHYSRIRQGQPSPEAPIPVRNPPIRQRWYPAKSLAGTSQNAMTPARHIRPNLTAKRIFVMGDWA